MVVCPPPPRGEGEGLQSCSTDPQHLCKNSQWINGFTEDMQTISLNAGKTFQQNNLAYAACSLLVAYLPYSSNLMMEVVSSSETYMSLYRTIQNHIPEGNTFQKTYLLLSYEGNWWPYVAIGEL